VRKNRSTTPLVLGLAYEGEARGHAPGSCLVLEVLGHEAAAVIMAQLDAAGGVAAEMAELLAHGHAHGLQRLAARAALADVPAERLRVPVFHRGEEPDLAVAHRGDLRAVDGPYHVRRVGDDLPVMVVGGAWAGAVWRQEGVLAHQPQHPLARDAQPVPDAQPRPDLAMALARPGRAGEVGPDRRQQGGVRDRGLRPAAAGRLRGGQALRRLPGQVER
jgi:hypothetical protein